MIQSVIIEGVRCFSTRQEVPLRPITVLVGENSSGKSTFLALTRIAWGLAQGQIQIDFNEQPFQLGAFDQVASMRGGRSARPSGFCVGATLAVRPNGGSPGERPVPVTIVGTYVRRGVEPRLRRWAAETPGEAWEVTLPLSDSESPKVVATAGADRIESDLSDLPSGLEQLGHTSLVLSLGILATLRRVRAGEKPSKRPDFRLFDFMQGPWNFSADLGPRPIAFAPVRTQPQRTYDPLKEIPRPEGSHVPVTLARLSAGEPEAWRRLVDALNEFGAASGLFSGLEVRKVGRKDSDPFQIQVNVSGQPFNLVDVGYGVSQVLPILVDILRGQPTQMFLLQQPEVHLHPRAQAELATLLSSLVTLQEKHFVVETHSDHLVDRLRMDVRDKRNLKADQVLILYFERQGGQVQIHPIEIDEQGNLVNVPPGYRSFFLEEDRRLLGIA